MRFSRNLGVITHVPHWLSPEGVPCAYEPYVREMRVWASLFAKIEICAPIGEGAIRGNLAPYECQNISWTPVNYSLSEDSLAPLKRLAQLPKLLWALYSLINRNDLIHLRSPGHLALFGYSLARFLRKDTITKWAGLFDGFARERWPSKIERWLIHFPAPRHPVLIYGPSQHEHHISFLPALMSKQELNWAEALASKKIWLPPWNILSVGRLTHTKGFDLAVKGLGEFNRIYPRTEWQFTLVGDGEEMNSLRQLVLAEGLKERVRFAGALPFGQVQQFYADAHIVIMPGTLEGWPKPIAEAWAHRAIPLAAAAGLVPWILRSGDVGALFDPDPRGLAVALGGLLENPERMYMISKRLSEKTRELSLESFQARLEEVLITRLGVN